MGEGWMMEIWEPVCQCDQQKIKNFKKKGGEGLEMEKIDLFIHCFAAC